MVLALTSALGRRPDGDCRIPSIVKLFAVRCRAFSHATPLGRRAVSRAAGERSIAAAALPFANF